jgi:hypothetical protein
MLALVAVIGHHARLDGGAGGLILCGMEPGGGPAEQACEGCGGENGFCCFRCFHFFLSIFVCFFTALTFLFLGE